MGAHEITAQSTADSQHLPRYGTGRSAAALAVERHDGQGSTTLRLTGELDLDSVPLLRRELARCLAGGVHAIWVDLAGVTFCDCSGLSALLQAHRRGTTVGASLRLHRPGPVVARLIVLAGAESTLLPRNGTSTGHLSVRALPVRDAAVDRT